MEEKEFNLLIEKIERAMGEKMEAKLKDAFKDMNPDVLKSMTDNSAQIEKNIQSMQESNAKLEKALETQGEELAKLKEEGSSKFVSLKEQIHNALVEKADALVALKNGDSKSNVKLEVSKAAANMLISTNVVAAAPIPQAEREGGITRIVRRNPFILELVQTGSISSNLWEWVQQVNADGDAAMTAEGAAKAQIDFDLALASAQVRKVTAYVKVSKEMLDDVGLIEAEINQELREVINLKIDAQLLSGDGLGQNLVGILENATAWAAGSFALAVDEANNADVLRVAINQIQVAQFQPSYIVMHPSDCAGMDMEKASDGHYVLKPFTSVDGMTIKGIPVITNTGVTEGNFLVGDFSKSAVRFKEGLVFDIGYENDDFTKNFVTILAEARLVHRVKSNHYAAFVTGTFATAKVALETA